MSESLKSFRFTTEKISRVFNHKSSWNNFSDKSSYFLSIYLQVSHDFAINFNEDNPECAGNAHNRTGCDSFAVCKMCIFYWIT